MLQNNLQHLTPRPGLELFSNASDGTVYSLKVKFGLLLVFHEQFFNKLSITLLFSKQNYTAPLGTAPVNSNQSKQRTWPLSWKYKPKFQIILVKFFDIFILNPHSQYTFCKKILIFIFSLLSPSHLFLTLKFLLFS